MQDLNNTEMTKNRHYSYCMNMLKSCDIQKPVVYLLYICGRFASNKNLRWTLPAFECAPAAVSIADTETVTARRVLTTSGHSHPQELHRNAKLTFVSICLTIYCVSAFLGKSAWALYIFFEMRKSMYLKVSNLVQSCYVVPKKLVS